MVVRGRRVAAVGSEPQPICLERDEIDEADRIVTRPEAGAFTRIEDQRLVAPFVPMAMGMTV